MRTLALPIAVLFGALGLSCAASTRQPVAFTAPGDSVVVPFLFRNNHILVRGTVGPSDSLWFIVDSGAGSHCLDQSAAERLKLTVHGGVQALGSGGRTQAGMTHDVLYRLPGVEVNAPWAAVIDLAPIALQLGHPVDGILGYPLFDHSVCTVDYDRSELVLHDPDRYEAAGASFPLTFRENHPYVDASVALTGRRAETGSFVLDTGSALALVLAPDYVAKAHAAATAPKTVQGRLGGVGGLAFHPVGRIDRLTLGPYALERPVAVFSNPGPGQSSAPGSLGNIGGDVLQRFRVTFDYPRKRLTLVPGASFARPFEWDMTGLTLVVQPKGTVAVMAVEPGSPAAEAGVREGDVVASVDGRPLVAADLAALRQRMRAEGTALALGLERAGAHVEAALVTRRLI